jgi:hypothetical protein
MVSGRYVPVAHERNSPPRFYRCPACDVYGRGHACWTCSSTQLHWDQVPPLKLPASRGMLLRELVSGPAARPG